MAKQGISGQKLLFGRDRVFKYVDDKSKIPGLKSQYEYLSNEIPLYGMPGLQWIESGGKYGFTMSKLNDDIELRHIKQMVQYVKHIKDWNPHTVKTIEQLKISDFVNIDFWGYIEYVMDIIYSNPNLFKKFDEVKFNEMLDKYGVYCVNETSYYHGDFTIHNILIYDNDNIVPIDSNFKGLSLWGSYLLDLSKMFQDVHLVDNEMYGEILKEISIQFPDVKLELLYLLELTHYIRMIPYAFKHSEGLGIEKINKFLELSELLGLKIKD